MDLRNKVALLTGAGRGIGKAIALALADNGINLALVARNSKELEETARQARERGGKALVLPYDLGETSGLETLTDRSVAEFGKLDILINNAGIGAPRVSVADADLKLWDKVLDVNLRALVHLTRHALGHMEKNSSGAIINIASIAGIMGIKGAGAYCASKYGVVGFTEVLFEDVREKNIKVCAICPGYVDTPLVAKYGFDPETMIQPSDVAAAVLSVLNFPQSACPTRIVLRPQQQTR